jgi:hypothetical protein
MANINLVSLDDALIEAEDYAIAILTAADGLGGDEARGIVAIADHHRQQMRAIRQQVTDALDEQRKEAAHATS